MNMAQSEFPTIAAPELPFADRRQTSANTNGTGERRQFGNSYHNLSSAGKELAEAIDAYKLEYRRRYITTDECFDRLRISKGLMGTPASLGMSYDGPYPHTRDRF